MPRTATLAIVLGCSLLALVAKAEAATLMALNDNKALVLIATDSKKMSMRFPLPEGTNLLGFDIRPSDKKVYGVTADGAIVQISATDGKLEKKAQISEMLDPSVKYSADFNPADGLLVLATSEGRLIKIDVDTGMATAGAAMRAAEGDNKTEGPAKIAALAFAVGRAGEATAPLYVIDQGGSVFSGKPDTSGSITLTKIGNLGIMLDDPPGFDISTDSTGKTTGWMVVGGTLYSVDLATGKASTHGELSGLKGTIEDITVLSDS